MPMGKGYGSMKPKNKKKIKMVKKIKPNKMAKRGKAQGDRSRIVCKYKI